MKVQQAIRKRHPEWEFPDFDEVVFAKKRRRYCICVFVINEGQRIRKQLRKMTRLAPEMDIVIADGGSTDNSLDEGFLKAHNVRALLTKRGKGKLSAQMRMAFAWAVHEGYEGVIVVDGNNKDSVERATQFTKLLDEGYDHVQGSRFIPGGKAVNTPLSREIGLHFIHAPLISIAAGKRHTDTTNGFRGYSARLLTDSSVGVFRDVFQTYEMHYYLAIESSRRKAFKTIETPVIRTYPRNEKTPTKISPIKGNLHVLSVLFKVVLGLYRPRRITSRWGEGMRTHWVAILALLALAGFLFNVAVAYPGYMSLDSLRQLRQALGDQPYTDWHPPIMAYLWGVGIQLTGKVSFALIAQSAMIWSALALLSMWIYRTTRSMLYPLLPLFMGISPVVIAVSGVVWKDVHMAASLLLAVCIWLYTKDLEDAPKKMSAAIIVALMLYAVLLRDNAILAVLPLLYYMSGSWGISKKHTYVGMAVFIVLYMAIGWGIARKLDVEATNHASSVMLDDVVHVLEPREMSPPYTSPELSDALLKIQKKCDTQATIVHAYHFCSTPEQQPLIKWGQYEALRDLWIATLLKHPLKYLEYRTSTMWMFMTTPRGSEYIQNSYVITNEYHITTRHKALSEATTQYVDFFVKDFGLLFRPYFWLAVAVGIFVYVRRHRRTLAHHAIVSALVISSALYIIGYYPVVLAADYRYVYWSVLATSVALILIIIERRSIWSKRR